MRWTAQRPLTIALWSSVIAALGCIALAIADRRRTPAPVSPPARWAGLGPVESRRTRVIAAAAWIVGSVVLIGPEWAGPAAAGAAILLLIGRPRVAGVVSAATLAVIGTVIVEVVVDERPWPDAGWPARFEWLHGWGLFAAVALAVSALGRASARRGLTSDNVSKS